MSYRGEQKIKGKLYVYEATASWNAEKKRSEQKRTYIGTRDPETGEFVPNKKYYEIYGSGGSVTKEGKPAPPMQVMRSQDFGSIYLMRQAAVQTGLLDILKECFPDSWEEILACAMHCCSENEALYLCEQWASGSYSLAAPSAKRISRLWKELDEDSRMRFYKRWAELRQEKEYLALDITSVSSWSDLIQYAEYGYNRDHGKLPQVNLAMLFGESSRLPVFSRIYPGSVKDVSTLAGMAVFIEQLKLKQMHFVMDKGFYSEKGIRFLLEKYIKFAIGVPFTTRQAKTLASQAAGTIASPSNAVEVDGHIYYASTVCSTMHGRRVYFHVYYDEERHAAESSRLLHKILEIEKGLAAGTIKRDDVQSKKYFSFYKTKDGSYNIHRKDDVIEEEVRYAGFFVILTNDSSDSRYMMEVYRTKDAVEKSFHNIKNELDLHRLRIHSDEAMEGRVFLGFIALILMSYICEKMRKENMYKTINEQICKIAQNYPTKANTSSIGI